jgi:hypothetical protein
MVRASLFLAPVLLSAAVVVGPATPAHAWVITHWRFDGPAAGMPATDVAARTISGAEVYVSDGPEEEERVRGGVVLGALPDDSSEADLHLVMGVPDGEQCLPRWELVVPTSSAAVDDSGDAVVHIDYPVTADDWEIGSCVYVSLTSIDAAATVYDRWDGTWDGETIADPGGLVRIKDVQVPDSVRPHRWFPVRVELKNVQSDLDGVRLTGEGKDLRAMPTMLGGMESGESMVARLWVRLRVDEARRLRITTTPYGEIAFANEDSRTVMVRPR